MGFWSIAKALMLWLAIFIPSSIAGSIAGSALSKARREHVWVAMAAIFTQVLFASLSIVVPTALGLYGPLDLLLNPCKASTLLVTLCTSVALMALSLAMNIVNNRLVKLGRSPFTREIEELLVRSTALGLLALLVLAPIGEKKCCLEGR